MDLHTRAWSDECLRLFGIRRDCLPTIVSNSEEYGRVANGPLAGVPICGSLGDQQAALLGASLLRSTIIADHHHMLSYLRAISRRHAFAIRNVCQGC